jgi:hypothetical protein
VKYKAKDGQVHELDDDGRKAVEQLKSKLDSAKNADQIARAMQAAGTRAWGKLSFRERRRSPLRPVFRDLEVRRLGQLGLPRLPSYREQLEQIIEDRFDSAAAFCQATGLDPGQVSHVLNGDKAFSLSLLERALNRIGFHLKFEPIAKSRK